MIELPEALALSRQINAALAGKTVSAVLPPTKPHKFCWFDGDPAEYEERLRGREVVGAEGFGIYVELDFGDDVRLCVNDGVNMRLVASDADVAEAAGLAKVPKDYQLLIAFADGTALAFTVAMYGGIVLHGNDYDNEYYLKSRAALVPWADGFAEQFWALCGSAKPSLSAKAFLATDQRFPGIGNGVLQDILFAAGIHPKRKVASLGREERERLLASVVSVTQKMADEGGRDTEKDIFGCPGGYKTYMSKNSRAGGCPACGGTITKEAYLGGSVYYCPHCQAL